jgi:hypothetical protein
MNRIAIVILMLTLLVLGAWLVIDSQRLPLSSACVHDMDCSPEDVEILKQHGGGFIPGVAVWVKEPPKEADSPDTRDVLIGMIIVCFASLIAYVLVPEISTRG